MTAFAVPRRDEEELHVTDTFTFPATVELGGRTATGIEIPADVVAALGSGRRPAVSVTIAGYTYRTTVASRDGRFLVSLSAENREAAGVAAGDRVELTIALDTAARDVTVPADLAQGFADDDAARTCFEGLAPSHRKEWVRWIEEAKRPETRARRLQSTLEALRAGKRTR